jgi:hypothetical protein
MTKKEMLRVIVGVLLGAILTLITTQVVYGAQANLSWTINAPSATETHIERREDGQPASSYAEIAKILTPTTSYTDKGIVAGTLYCYRLRSTSPSSNSLYSGDVCMFAPITGIVLIYTP